MAIAKMYTYNLATALAKEWSWTADPIHVTLHTSSYTPNQETHQYWASASASELSAGGGYTANGIVLSGKQRNVSGRIVTLTSTVPSIVWTNSTLTARYAIIRANVGSGPLLGFVDFQANQSSSSGDFRITWNAAGIFTYEAGA